MSAHFLCILRLTNPWTYDSLQCWLCCGHIVVGEGRLDTRRKGWRKGPGTRREWELNINKK